MVHKRSVLVGIQHLQESGRWVAMVATLAQFVNLINEYQRIGHSSGF